MKLAPLSGLLLLIFALTSCSLDIFYPHPLVGSMYNGVYTTRIGKKDYAQFKFFKVNIPQYPFRFETPFLQTKEIFGERTTLLSFGPVAADETIYRLLVQEKGDMPLTIFKEHGFPMLIDLFAEGYDRQMVKVYGKHTEVNGLPALYEVYTQYIPGYHHYISRHQAGDVVLTHFVYTVDYGCYGVIFWIQASTDSAMNFVNYKNRWEVIHHGLKPYGLFLRSFVIV